MKKEELENLENFATAVERSAKVCEALEGDDKVDCRLEYISVRSEGAEDGFDECFEREVSEGTEPKEAVKICTVED